MWYSYYMDGWHSFYIPKATPLETYPQLSNVSWRDPLPKVVEYCARGPPIIFRSRFGKSYYCMLVSVVESNESPTGPAVCIRAF